MLVNNILNILMRLLTGFEKHHSLDSSAKSLSTRLFVVQFLNTGWLVLVANANIPNFKWAVGVRYSDFEAEWYGGVAGWRNVPCPPYGVTRVCARRYGFGRYLTVGSSIIFTMLLTVFTPQLIPTMRYVVAQLRRHYAMVRFTMTGIPLAPACRVWFDVIVLNVRKCRQ